MISLGKKNLLGVHVDAIDYGATVARVIAAARAKESMTVSALAVHGVMVGAMNAEHRYRLNHLDIAVPDGQPVRWALNLLHRSHLPDRVAGPMLTLKVCEAAAAAGIPIYLYGSRTPVLIALRRNLCAQFPGLIIAGAQPSRFRILSREEKLDVAENIRTSGAAIVFVGLGCPRQEVWVHEYRDLLSMPILAVGAAFDFHAGLLPHAPMSLQRLGLEWLFRLWHEPRRLWKRYLLLNPMYIALVTTQALGLRDFERPAVGPPPEISYG